MERMLRKKKNNSEYEIDRELTGKFAIEKNAEYQDRIAELEEEIKRLNIIIENTKIEQEADRKHIEELEEENKELEERLSEIAMVADDEKQSIEHILELEEENKKLKEELEWYREHYREKVDEEVLKGFGYNKKEIV